MPWAKAVGQVPAPVPANQSQEREGWQFCLCGAQALPSCKVRWYGGKQALEV